jgi:hypothetical protein
VLGSKFLQPHMEVIWLSLMKEIFQPVEQNIEQEALNVFVYYHCNLHLFIEHNFINFIKKQIMMIYNV